MISKKQCEKTKRYLKKKRMKLIFERKLYDDGDCINEENKMIIKWMEKNEEE